jgi:hypothetical protein
MDNPSNSSKDSSKSDSSHIHLKYSFSHIIIEIHLQGSNQFKVVAREKSEKGLKEGGSEKRQNASHKKYGF